MKYRITNVQIGYDAGANKAKIEIKCMRAERILQRGIRDTDEKRERVMSYPKRVVLTFYDKDKVELFQGLEFRENGDSDLDVIEE